MYPFCLSHHQLDKKSTFFFPSLINMSFDPATFVKPNEECICEICTQIMGYAVVVCKNGHTYCKTCIRRWKERNQTCPSCRQRLLTTCIPNRSIQSQIERMDRKCMYQGCMWSGKVYALKIHHDICPFAPVECIHLDCTEQPRRNEQKQHERECPHKKSPEELALIVSTRLQRSSDMSFLLKAANLGCALAQYIYGQKKQSLQWMEQAASQGYVEAQIEVARWYHHGKGVPKNKKVALSWYQEASDQGHVEAKYHLGVLCYESGDTRKAVEMITLCADTGYCIAQTWLGKLFADQKQKWFCPAKSAHYYLLAADQGDGLAQFQISEYYRTGAGVQRNTEKAEHYLSLAVRHHPEAQYQVGMRFSKPGQPEYDPKQAEFYLCMAADQNHSKAQYQLAELLRRQYDEAYDRYVEGAEKEKDTVNNGNHSEAKEQDEFDKDPHISSLGLDILKYYEMSAEGGHREAQASIAELYSTGYIVEEDQELARDYFRKAAYQGCARSIYAMGEYIWRDSDGAQKQRALKHFSKAAELGYSKAWTTLAQYYSEDKKVYNMQMALQCCHRAIESQQVDAMRLLAKWCFDGKGMKRDLQKSLEWFTKAVRIQQEQKQYSRSSVS